MSDILESKIDALGLKIEALVEALYKTKGIKRERKKKSKKHKDSKSAKILQFLEDNPGVWTGYQLASRVDFGEGSTHPPLNYLVRTKRIKSPLRGHFCSLSTALVKKDAAEPRLTIEERIRLLKEGVA